jgi:hypothetical protein
MEENRMLKFTTNAKELKKVLDDDKYPAAHKITAFTKKTRQMIKNGEDTGFQA